MLKRLLLGLLVLGSGISLLGEARRASTSWDARAEWELPRPDDWRLGSPPVARLESCLAAARRLVPAGGTVAFTTPAEPPESALLYMRWAAYLMPAQDVFRPGDAPARYVLSWRVPLAGPKPATLRPARELPGCFLYEASRP
ncbi:MAG TPA: hypothetical protein VGQ28_14610 [Thermoanaerobaculia bacterium]|jgi:hypothetical protein|nr:hypothetical protein [Thermoanaerobaculia bacterium]